MKAECSVSRERAGVVAVADRALETGPPRYREFFEFYPDGCVLTDVSGVIQEANRATTALLNMERGALIGKPLLGVVVEADRNVFFAQLGGLLRVQAPQDEWEVRVQRRGGTPFPAAITATLVRDSSGSLVGLSWVLRDVTERWLAEEALRESNDLLSKLVQYAHDAIFIIEPAQRKILDVNPAACRLLGYSRKQALALAAPALSSDPQSKLGKFIEAVLEQGEGKTDDLVFVTHSGEVLPVTASAASINVAGAACIILMARESRTDREAEVQTGPLILSGLLPICSSCKKIRDGAGAWHALEDYIASHSDAQFTHGLCAECLPRFMPGGSGAENKREEGRS